MALSLGSLRHKIETALLPDDVRVVLQLDGLAERERHRRRVLLPHERHRRGMRPELSRSAIAVAVPVVRPAPSSPHRGRADFCAGHGENLDVAAADQSRPSATRAAKLIHPMRRIFIPHLGKMGLAYFSPSECEVAHTSRGINGGHQTLTGPRRPYRRPLARGRKTPLWWESAAPNNPVSCGRHLTNTCQL